MDGEDPFNLLGAPVINHDPTIVLMDLESAPVPINRSNIARDCLVRLVRAKGWMGPLYIEGVVGDNTDDRISRRCFNRLLDSGIAITSIGIGDVKQVVDNYIYKKFEFIFDHHMNAPFNLVLVAADSDYLLWLQTFAGNDNSNFFLICYTVSAGEDMRSFEPQVSWAKILNAHQRYRKENNGPQLDNGPFYGHDEDGGPNGGPNTPFFARPEFYQVGREPGRPPGRLPEVPGYNGPQTFFRQQGLALNFGDEPGKQVRSAIKIKNTSKSHVAFKFQTTAPKSCFMRPPGAIPAPGETLIAIVFKFVEPPENNEKPMDQRSRVKFEIMSLKVKGPMDYVPELFDEQKEDVSKEQILRVIFLDPERPNPALENLKRQLAEADAAVEARKKPPEETGPKMIGEGLVIDEWKQELGAEINPNPSLIERAIYCQ